MAFTTFSTITVPIPSSVTQGIQLAKDGTTARAQYYGTSWSGGRSYLAINSATTTSAATAERLCNIVVTGGSMGAITIYDNPSAASGTILWAIATSVVGVTAVQIATSSAGITVVTAAATNVNVTYD